MMCFLCISLSACITEDEEMENGNNLEVGDRIPSFSVMMNDGSRVEDKDLLGKVSLIVFFNTACKDCQQELPVLQRFYEAYPNIPWYASAGRKMLHRYPAIGKSKDLRCHILHSKTGRFISCLPAIPFLASMWWMKKESSELSLRTIHWPVMRIWCRLWREYNNVIQKTEGRKNFV